MQATPRFAPLLAISTRSDYNLGSMLDDEQERQLRAYGLSPEDLPESGGQQLLRSIFDPTCATGIYSVPRRFDLATIFVVTAAYSVLLGGLTAIDATPTVKTIVAVFVTVVAVSQAALAKVVHPRGTSIIAGAVANTAIVAILWLEMRRHIPISFLFVAIAGVPFGAFLGYLAGAVVAGVFLVADLLRGRFERPPPPAELEDIPLEEIH